MFAENEASLDQVLPTLDIFVIFPYNRTMNRESISCTAFYLGLAALTIITGSISCKKSSAIPSGPNRNPYVAIKITINVVDYQTGAAVSASIRFEGNNIDVTVASETEANLGTAPEGQSRDFKVTITATGKANKTYNTWSMQGTATYTTDVVDKVGMNWTAFINNFLIDGHNDRWIAEEHPDIELNEKSNHNDETLRLSADYINAMIDFLETFKSHSRGMITSVTFVGYKGQETAGAPPTGQAWTAHNTDDTGVVNFTFPDQDSPVTSTKVKFNPNSSIVLQVENEGYRQV